MYSVTILRPYHILNIVIQSNRADFIETIRQMYGTYCCNEVGSNFFQITVTFTQEQVTVATEEGTIQTEHPLQYVYNIVFDKIQIQDGIFAMHAAGLAYQNHAVILTAPTGTGKTTLAAYLIQQGFNYITDDCVYIDQADLSVLPCGNDIHLREGGMAVLTKYQAKPENLKRVVADGFDRFIFVPQNIITEKIGLGLILFIERGQENAVYAIPTAECIMKLMKTPMTHYEVNRGYLLFLQRLAAKPCKKLVYRDMSFVVDYLKETLT